LIRQIDFQPGWEEHKYLRAGLQIDRPEDLPPENQEEVPGLRHLIGISTYSMSV
jgi:hypothetical protein